MHRLQSSWLPLEKRSLLVSIITSGQDWGTILSYMITPLVINDLGWKYVPLLTWGFAVVWFLLFSIFGSSSPSSNRFINNDEKVYLSRSCSMNLTENEDEKQPFPLFKVMLRKEMWAIITMHFCFNYGWYVLIGWLPTYYRNELKVDEKQLYYTCLPYVVGVIGSYIAGFISSSKLFQSNISPLWNRRIFNSCGSIVPGIFLCILSTGITSPVIATFLLCATLFFARMATIGYWLNMIDIAPNHPEIIMGISNTIATIPGIVGNTVTGYILGTSKDGGGQRWNLVFGIGGGFFLLGGVIFLLLSGVDPIVDLEKPNLSVYERLQEGDGDGEEDAFIHAEDLELDP